MCTDVTHKDFITAHHELAHIQYFLNYRNNPKIHRDGANPGEILKILKEKINLMFCHLMFKKN